LTAEQEYDVICIGAGLGGFAAAITAHEMGLRPLVVEKSEMLGGVTALSGGQVWVPGNDLENASGIDDSWELGYTYINRISAGTADHERLGSLLRQAQNATRFFQEQTGVGWSICNLPDYYADVEGGLYRGRYLEARPFPGPDLGPLQPVTRLAPMYPERLTWNELIDDWHHGRPANQALHAERAAADVRVRGAGLMAWFVKAAGDRQIDIMTGAIVHKLLRDSDEAPVGGIEVSTGTRKLRLSAKRGVVLATGGHDGSPGLISPVDKLASGGSAAHREIEGDHLVLAGMLGARTAYCPTPKLFGFHVPGETRDDGSPEWRVVTPQPHAILVTETGRRFCDETHYIAINQALRVVDGRAQRRPNDPMFLIADNRYMSRFGLGGFSAADTLPEIVSQADSIRELAKSLGIDTAGLDDEVGRFNAAAAVGVDADFHRGENAYERKFLPLDSGAADVMGSIYEAPFVGVRLWPVGIGLAATGLVADLNGQVLNWRNEPIGGVYATGNSLALLETGLGYQSGFANMRGMTYGYLAVRHMASVR
jgi:3-oxosteroid 1-dehydrogenase